MSSSERCKECGAAIPAGTPAGLCALCLFGLGLAQAQAPEPEPSEAAAEGAERHEAEPASDESSSEIRGSDLPTAAGGNEKPGDRIGRYKLLQQIGEGGFGTVFMAEQLEPVQRKVALKVIKPGMDSREILARFEAERQALALMDHPNIARVLDGGTTASRRPYFVMELVKGIPITDYCDQASLSTRERLELFIKVCRAVQHAHQKGIIHRDLKPSNVLVTLHDGEPVPKVIDFGVAKALGQKLTEKTLFTRFEQMLGTPAYMSPEQAALGGLDIDTRSDIYSLGVLLYELLTGVTPLDKETLRKSAMDEIRRIILEADPPRPSTRLRTMGGRLTAVARCRNAEPAALPRAVRGDLDWITMKCLEKDRQRRYETVNGLARDIERHLNNEPVAAQPPSRLYEFQKTVRRHKVGFAATAAVIVALTVGVVVSTWQALRAKRAERDQNRLRLEAVEAKRDATEKLWGSYLAEARGRKHSGEAGQRFDSLAALSNAAALRPSLELRNEAIACLALADIRFLPAREKRFKRFQEFADADRSLERYALGGPDGTVSIRRLSDDQELKRLPEVAGPVRWLQFCRAADLLVVTYADKRMRFWDVATGKVVLEPPGTPISYCVSQSLVALLENRCITLYDFAKRQELKTIKLDAPASGVGPFDPEGRLLIVYSEDGTELTVLDIASEHALAKLVHPMSVSVALWHPGGRFLANACEDNLIYLWDTVSAQQVRTLQGHRGALVSLAFSPDGSLLVSSAWDGRIRLWDFGTGRELVSIVGGCNVSFGTDDRTLMGQGADLDWLSFFEVSHEKPMYTVHETGRVPGPPFGSACLSADGRLVAYDTIGGVTLFDLQAQREVTTLKQGLCVWGFGSNDQNLILGDSKGRLFRCPVGEATAKDRATAAPAVELVAQGIGLGGPFSANGKICANIESNRCHIFRTDTFTEIATTDVHPGMRFLALSPDGNLVATGPFHGHGVKIWDTHSGKLVKALLTQQEGITVAFSPDGRRLVTGMIGDYQFWDVGTWSPGLRIEQQPWALFSPMMAFSPDGRILAGSFGFTVVRLFDAVTGQVLGDLEPPNPWSITSLSFSPDGTQLVVCESRSALRLWDLRAVREHLAQMHLDWNLPPYPPKHSPVSAMR